MAPSPSLRPSKLDRNTRSRRAVVEAAREKALRVPEASGHTALPGAGMLAFVGGDEVRVGRPEGLPPALQDEAHRLAIAGQHAVRRLARRASRSV